MKKPRANKLITRGLLISGLLILSLFLAFKFSPWPSALLLRYVFEKDAEKTNLLLEKHVPKGVSEILDISYNKQDKDAFLDIYYPSNTKEKLPLVVWIHGGGWISGDKSQSSNYFKILASKGFVVASVNYSLGPKMHYPTPIKQVMQALKFLQDNSDSYVFQDTNIFLAGDSAGSQIATQVALILMQPAYAKQMQIVPSITSSALKGMLLYCGAYDLENIDLQAGLGFFLQSILWSYTGTKDFLTDNSFKEASVVHFIEESFPPSFISAGNGDPLLSHSQALAKKLVQKNVYIDSLFFPKNFSPALPHEYQFNLDLEAGNTALKRSIDFIQRISKEG